MKQRVKRKRRAKIFRLKWGRIIFLLVLICAFFYFVLSRSVFNISEILVEGNDKISKEDILEASNLSNDDNYFFLNKKKAKENLESLKYVKLVNIKRKLPFKIEINITEREACAMFPVNEKYMLIDSDGIILEIVDNFTTNFALIRGLKLNDNLTEGENIANFIKSEEQKQFLNSILNSNIFEKTNAITFDDKKIDLVMNKDINVAFGGYNNVDYKIKVLNKILEDVEINNIKANMILMEEGSRPILVTD
ncbi:MAG: FtsQ-type POTRA domain-containing protein [Tissierellia bacterium]|nr:FtsQ-type POTRA domain-containing protein [Tissierellia bacterium]